MRNNILPILVLLFAATAVFPESWIDTDFDQFGPGSVGIYTEAYRDNRAYISFDSEKSYLEAIEKIYARALLDNQVYRFKDYLCAYDGVTPPLTLPGYPLGGKESIFEQNKKIDTLLSQQLASSLDSLGWQSEIIEGFDGGKVKDLLNTAEKNGLDTVLLVRYYPIRFYIPFSGYSESRTSVDTYTDRITESAGVGALHIGFGLLPALELYDTRTGIRLWYSAYYTSHIETEKYLSQEEYGLAAEEFFIDGAITTLQGKTLTRKKQYNRSIPIEEAAIKKMIDLTMLDSAVPFPILLAPGNRDNGYTGSRAVKEAIRFTLWAEKSPLTFDTAFFSIGYTLNLPIDLDIYYDDSRMDEIDPVIILTAEDIPVHRFIVPVLSRETRNIVVEPSVFFDLYPKQTIHITYTDSDYNPDTEELEEFSRTSSVDFSMYTLGIDVTLKYLARLSEKLALFVGGSGRVEGWAYSQKSEDEKFNNQSDLYLDDLGGIIPVGIGTFEVNTSVIAGLRLFAASSPIDIYGIYTPRGPSGNPVFSVGATWHWGSFRAPYAKGCNRYD